MKFELLIASKLKLKTDNNKKSSPSLNIAIFGISVAIIVMIFALTIVFGFKEGISNKIYSLEPHIKITNATLGIDNNLSKVNSKEILDYLTTDSTCLHNIKNICLMADNPAMLKSIKEFKGLVFRGVDENFDWSFLKSTIKQGRVPKTTKTDTQEIIISEKIANELELKLNDDIITYFFINGSIKARKVKISGIYSSDFDTFDNSIILGNISLIQDVNNWNSFEGNYMAINLNNLSNLSKNAYNMLSKLDINFYKNEQATTLYNVSHTQRNNISFFSWLNLLDMNVIIVISLMAIVSAFTLISALLMIILERIKFIGLLKTLGATNQSIRFIFIHLTQKLIFKSIIIGNFVGLTMSWLQYKFHIIELDPEAYYLPYVPISINISSIIILNMGIIILSYASLIIPSLVISKIKPATTLKFE